MSQETMSDTVAQAEDLLDSPPASDPDARERLRIRASEARDKLNVVLHDLGSRAEVGYHKAEESLKHGIETTEAKIKEKPFAAVGIAAGVGLLLGLLVNRGR